MRRVRKMTFDELVKENREQLLQDKEALDRLEEKWEARHSVQETL